MPEPINFAEMFILLLKKYNFGNQNKYSAIMEVKKATIALLQRFKAEEEHKLEETEKHGTLFLDYTPKECEIYMYAYIIGRIDDLGRGIIVDIKSKGESKESGSSGRHMGTKTDEFLLEK